MASLKVWLKAIRAPFFTATLIPILLGSVIAWNDSGSFSFSLFFLVLMAALFLHAGTNLSNDYFDHKSGNDEANTTLTPFSGGSRIIQDKLIPAKQILIAALVFFVLGSIIGLYLNSILVDNVLVYLGLIGMFLGLFYTAPPFKIGYHGFGELSVGLGFGPIAVLAAYFVQTQALSLAVFYISIPIGILIALVLYINEFPDYKADKSVRKNTLVVLLGKKASVKIYILGLSLAYFMILYGIFIKILPIYILIVLLSLPLAIKATITLLKNYGKIEGLLPANKATIGLHILFGLLLVLGYGLNKVF